MIVALFPSPGEKALSTTQSPDGKSGFTFSRKHKRIPAALKEVTITIIQMTTMNVAHPCMYAYVSTICHPWLKGLRQHRQLLHEWLFAKVKGQQEARPEAVVCHQRQSTLHICCKRGKLSCTQMRVLFLLTKNGVCACMPLF